MLEGEIIAKVRISEVNPKLFIIEKISGEGPVISLSGSEDRDRTKPCLLFLDGVECARLMPYSPPEPGSSAKNKPTFGSTWKEIRMNKFDLGVFTKGVANLDGKAMCVLFFIVQIYDEVILRDYMDSPSS
jgi:hypothetical protein